MIYVVDVDGTICTKTEGGEYHIAKPFVERIAKINRLYDEGNTIIYFTARGMHSSDDNLYDAYESRYCQTKNQLETWGVKYHKLIIGKPYADVYIDDKAISDKDFFLDIE